MNNSIGLKPYSTRSGLTICGRDAGETQCAKWCYGPYDVPLGTEFAYALVQYATLSGQLCPRILTCEVLNLWNCRKSELEFSRTTFDDGRGHDSDDLQTKRRI